MQQEIERKFLITGDGWRETAGVGVSCCQGYINAELSAATVRVRLLGEQGFLTIKGRTTGISRSEMEYEIPATDTEYMLANFCSGGIVSKTRHYIKVGSLCWEVDVFSGLNAGLIVAEIELEREDQPFEKPNWLGAEVTFDPRYTNAALARRPFSRW